MKTKILTLIIGLFWANHGFAGPVSGMKDHLGMLYLLLFLALTGIFYFPQACQKLDDWLHKKISGKLREPLQ